MPLFDALLLKQRATRARRSASRPFLWDRAAAGLRDRLLDIRRDFAQVLEIAPMALVGDDDIRQRKKMATITHLSPFDDMAEGILPVDLYSQDAVISWGHLHWVEDLPGFLLQCRHALKPDGVFIASMIGGETLRELRDAIQQVELRLYGGISPRVSPFAALADMAHLMQSAGFALPVVDHDILTLTYPDLKALVADLRHAGETNAIAQRHKKILGKDFWPEVERCYCAQYSENGRLLATVEIISLIGWAPHDSQQKPLKRGSAVLRLAEALRTAEKGTGDYI